MTGFFTFLLVESSTLTKKYDVEGSLVFWCSIDSSMSLLNNDEKDLP